MSPSGYGTSESIPQRYTYTGREKHDRTHLMYYRYRMYSPRAGRFTARDPLDLLTYGGLFGYGQANPVLYIDPHGLVSYGDALHHWWYGNGEDYPLAFSEVDPGESARDFPSFLGEVKKACSSKANVNVNQTKLINLGLGHPVGRHTFRLSGTITYTATDHAWSFSGRIESASGRDEFDFDRTWFDDTRQNRTWYNEFSTWGGAVVGWVTSADDFYFVISGHRDVDDAGCCE